MKILIVSRGCPTSRYPLDGIFEFDQAKALQEAGHTVIFAVLDLRSIRRWREWGFRSFVKNGVQVEEINIPCGKIGNKALHIIGSWGFAKLYNGIEKKYGRPDVVHAHFTDVAYHCATYVKEKGIPLVVTEHYSIINQNKLPAHFHKMAKLAYQLADAVIAVSNPLASSILKHTEVVATVIPNILDSAIFENNFPARVQKAEEFQFVTTCNLIPRKRVSLLLQAFSKLPENTCLTILGDGKLRKNLEKEAVELDISSRVQFRGRCNRSVLQDSYFASDCFVLPSSLETFGVVYVEAMACGLPVIATRCGGPEDFVTEQNGLLVNVDDLEGLIKAMLEMYHKARSYDPALIQQSVLEQFSAEQVTKKLINIYQKIV